MIFYSKYEKLFSDPDEYADSAEYSDDYPNYPLNENECKDYDFYDVNGVVFNFDECLELIRRTRFVRH